MSDAAHPGELRVHPLIAKLIEEPKGGEGIVTLEGFIGPAEDYDAPVTLYTDLDLSERILIPRDAILYVQDAADDAAVDEPTKVFVKGSADVRVVNVSDRTIRADEAPLTIAMGVKLSVKLTTPNTCRIDLGDCVQKAKTNAELWACKNKYAKCLKRAVKY